MRKMRRRNQLVIAGLAMMIAVAGYLNFSGKEITLLQPEGDVDTVSVDAQEAVELEASAKDDEQILYDSDDMLSDGEQVADAESVDAKETASAVDESADDALVSAKVDDSIPEEMAAVTDDAEAAVVETGATVHNRVLNAQLTKEQSRSKNKELLLELINSDKVTKSEKKNATKQLLQISQFMEKEAAAEQVLAAKGYQDSMVSMSEDSVDVMVSMSEISDTDRAKIEDVVQRKTGVSINNIVISTLK